MLVRPAWAEEHLQDKDVVLLAVGKKEEYLAAHIPGSRYLDFSDLSTPAPPAESNAMILEIPPPERVEETLSKAGVRNSSHIVLYSTGGNATMTARAYLTLDAMGLGASSSILDGGLPLWQHEGRLVTQEVRAVPPGSLKLCPRNDVVADLDYVRSQVRKPNAVIVDA